MIFTIMPSTTPVVPFSLTHSAFVCPSVRRDARARARAAYDEAHAAWSHSPRSRLSRDARRRAAAKRRPDGMPTWVVRTQARSAADWRDGRQRTWTRERNGRRLVWRCIVGGRCTVDEMFGSPR